MNRHDVYRFIATEKTSYPVRLLCRLLGVGQPSGSTTIAALAAVSPYPR